MRPPDWNPPIELSEAEQAIISRIKRAKLFIFLRHNRHDLFDEEFQATKRHYVQGQYSGSVSSSEERC